VAGGCAGSAGGGRKAVAGACAGSAGGGRKAVAGGQLSTSCGDDDCGSEVIG